jgi:hypothetical protein
MTGRGAATEQRCSSEFCVRVFGDGNSVLEPDGKQVGKFTLETVFRRIQIRLTVFRRIQIHFSEGARRNLLKSPEGENATASALASTGKAEDCHQQQTKVQL